MQLTEVFKLALKAIVSNKVRAGLTMLGIIIGVAAVILLVSLGQGLQQYITRQFEDLGTNLVVILPGRVSLEEGFGQGPPNFAGSKLTIQQAARINTLGGAIEAAGAANELPLAVQYKAESKYTTVAGITANYAQIRNLEVEEGRNISEADVEQGRKVVVLGRGIEETLFGQTNALGQQVTIGEDKFQVIGILRKLGTASIGFDVDNFAAMPLTSAQRLSGTSTVQTIVVKATSKEEVPDAISQVKRFMSRELKDDEYSVLDQSSLLGTINQILGILTLALGGIAAISLVVGGIGIMNIMLVSVTERTKEIGLRKAIGAKPIDILTQFLIEAIVLSLVGGAIGIALGFGGSLIIQQYFPAQVTLWSVALAFGVSSVVGIIFGVAPAIRASRLQPIEALRYE